MERCQYRKCKWPEKLIDLRDPGQFRRTYKGKKYHDNCLIKMLNEENANGKNN